MNLQLPAKKDVVPKNDDEASKRFGDTIVESLQQNLLPKVFQHTVISLLKNGRIFNADFLAEIKKIYQEVEQAKNVLMEQLSHEDLQRTNVDCHKGCFHCCSLIVRPTMPELYIIFEHIKKTNTKQEIDTLMHDLRAHVINCEQSQTLKERVKVYCTFLKDNACSIHEARPLSCRAYTSTDVNKCIEFTTDPTVDIPISICHYSPYDIARKAIMKSMYISNFTDVTEELNSGVLRLLKGEYGGTDLIITGSILQRI